jgi:hypothetical protein
VDTKSSTGPHPQKLEWTMCVSNYLCIIR